MLFSRLLPIDFALYSGLLKRRAVPAVIGAVLSLFCIKSGFLFLFFLVPLGVLAFRYGEAVAWTGLLLAVLGDALMAVMTAAAKAIPLAETMWDFLYFLIMASIFMWICSPPKRFLLKLPGVLRLIAGSCLGAILVTALLFRAMAAPGFLEYLDSWIKAFASVNRSDVVRLALLDGMSAEYLIEIMKAVMLRGGSLVSCIFIFFTCRQLSIVLARLNTGANTITGNMPEIAARGVNFLGIFHVDPEVIWIFSFSLLLVVLTRIFTFVIPEIILWNVLLICVMLYLAQGLGILQFFLTRPSTPHFLRLLAGILFIVLMFSPVINAVLLGGLFFLGIVENWIPLRAPKQNGPPSTP